MQRRLLDAWSDIRNMQAGFRWQIPDRLNIAHVCCEAWAAAAPERTAIVHVSEDGRRELWSYGRLKAVSDALALSLAARGVGRGDRVAVLLAQCPEVLAAHMAIHKLGGVVLPLFTLFGPEALAFRLADSAARAAITDAAGVEKLMALRPELPELAEIYSIDPAPAPIRHLADEIAAAHGAPPPADTAAEDPAVLIYTSGTTGPPKGALHAHRFMIGHWPSIETTHPRFASPGDVGWTPADWAWVGGLMDMAIPCLAYGVPLVAHRMRKFDPEAAFALIAREGINRLFLPPTALKLMRQAPAQQRLSVRSITSGGESLGAALSEWAEGTLGAPVNEIYGQTECNLVIGSCHGLMEVREGSMGLATPGHEVAVIDPEGRALPPGEIGEIAVRAPDPVMFLGYWNKPEKTAEKFTGSWMRTGDLARRDEDGYFWFVSRDDDVITSAGYRIGPSEIENCLTGHADVVNAAVIGVPDPVRTEIVKAYVVLRPGAAWSEALAEELKARVRARISPHVAPRLIEPIDSLPMTATGKVMRRALRERAT
ncbi:acetyl-CoA synthetase [Meinhardsimonia xiamenensis]|jgi:acetyl-CoA synthetase|uniref:Acetyl-CoA synthetase n=1 Tax=Meinhardsimonia xiamenensis TaxID=990712 RepID=A0A1G9F9S1_9RHOB|nr:AMP-binding protein [Meinhardsimonia xiamenensis]PRX37931.1 acetyl-CoA synthetase [Meinhardsimonia xiamenensis]SDK85149.1 acetyl-CoA synthetase [Meinhardsimonia xiamenensis]